MVFVGCRVSTDNTCLKHVKQLDKPNFCGKATGVLSAVEKWQLLQISIECVTCSENELFIMPHYKKGAWVHWIALHILWHLLVVLDAGQPLWMMWHFFFHESFGRTRWWELWLVQWALPLALPWHCQGQTWVVFYQCCCQNQRHNFAWCTMQIFC